MNTSHNIGLDSVQIASKRSEGAKRKIYKLFNKTDTTIYDIVYDCDAVKVYYQT